MKKTILIIALLSSTALSLVSCDLFSSQEKKKTPDVEIPEKKTDTTLPDSTRNGMKDKMESDTKVVDSTKIDSLINH